MSKKLEFDAHLRPTSKRYVPKARIVSRKCKWSNKGMKDELFFTCSMSVTKFIPGVNENIPTGFIDLHMGQFNKFKINTRDFASFAESITVLKEFIDKHKEDLDKVMEKQLDNYTEHQYKKLQMLEMLKKS